MKKDDLTLLQTFIHVLTQGGKFETEYELVLEERFLVSLVLMSRSLTNGHLIKEGFDPPEIVSPVLY